MLSTMHNKDWLKKITLAQKYTTCKKSTILVQSSSNLVKIISPWVGNIAKISAKSEQNCGFFISNIFLVSIILFESVSRYKWFLGANLNCTLLEMIRFLDDWMYFIFKELINHFKCYSLEIFWILGLLDTSYL